ncbi:MAG: hypothetical protein CVV27_05910 [Candidatus Melainabacteria bacterium HGW-Melainabacteria-1]|nr:MAG: hypothetical protein CVV27_05910 [Candidatus Melainabacteria bacterium HGW-Melainabacteria-1]
MPLMLKPSDLQNLQLLGQGPGRRVWRGLAPDDTEVVLKTFSLADAPNWKAQELFGREARVLQQLTHPALPQLLAFGESDGEAWLIYAYVSGESLAARLAQGWRPELAEVLSMARQLLSLLDWLHGHQPPIVHRDIKPSNLILQPDGQLVLIDFGSVLLNLHPAGGSTVAGTFGYMAPEQFSGRALPVSDLYAVGATLIQLLTGQAPADLPNERLWICFEDRVVLPPSLIAWIKSLIHPLPEERCPSARQALTSLDAPARPLPEVQAQALSKVPALPPGKPNLDVIQTHHSDQGLEIVLPPRPLRAPQLKFYVITSGIGSLYCLVMIGQIYRQLGSLAPQLQLPALISLLALTIGGVLWENRRLQRVTGADTRLNLRPEGLQLEETLGGRLQSHCEIPWQQLTVRRHQGSSWLPAHAGVELRYQNADGRRRRKYVAVTCEPQEQVWLSELLLSQRKVMLQSSHPPPDI